MVVTKTVDNRWMKRYRLFFAIGFVILTFQVYLALRFFTINTENPRNPNPYPYRQPSADDTELSANSARRSNSLPLDDEDVHNVKAKKTPNKPAQSRLRVEELDFTPACEINTKEAISAIHRAKTQRCKQTISNVTCLIQNGQLYPAVLPNYCPSEGFVAGKSLGCFKDEKNFRLLNGYYGNNKNSNSPEYCIRLCLQSGFPYAGVQYS